MRNIDKLLKDNFTDFAPDAPNVWQGVQQGMQAAQSAGITTAVKGTSLLVKVIASIITVASALGAIVFFNQSNPIAIVQNKTVQIDSNATQPQVENVKSTSTMGEIKSGSPVTLAKPIASSKQVEEPAIEIGDLSTTHIETMEEVQTDEAMTKQVTPEKSLVVLPIVNAHKKVEEHLHQDKKEDQAIVKQTVKPPYNPNVEEGEFEKPTIPGSFSPDGDGLNDVFKILIEKEQLFELTVYDKNGKVVFQSNDKLNTWDGKDVSTGSMCALGTYTVLFKYQFKGSENQRNYRGIVRLF